MNLFKRYGIRVKILISTLVFLIIFFVLEATILHQFFLGGFESAEEQDMVYDVQRVEALINNEISSYSIKLIDWTTWDDSYNFVVDGNQAYIDSNLQTASLTNLRLNFMVFIASSGAVMYERGVSLETEKDIAVPKDFHELLSKSSKITSHKTIESKFQGIIRIESGILLIASGPILTSNGEGPIRGTIVFARYLDNNFIKKIATLEGSNVRISDYYKPLNEEFKNAKQAMPTKGIKYAGRNGELNSYLIYKESTQLIDGFTIINDSNGKPAFIIENELSRPFYALGSRLVFSVLILFALISSASIAFAILLLNKFVINKITRLKKDLNKVSDPSIPSIKLEVLGSDEFADLAKNINTMLDSIARSQEALKGSDENLKKEKEELDRKVKELNNAQKAMVSLLEDEKEVEEKLRINTQELMNFKLAIESTSDHIVMTDPDGIVVYGNKAAEKLTGFSLEEMKGQTPRLWGKQMSQKFYDEMWDTIKNKKQTFAGEIMNRRKDGSLYPVEARISPILNEKGDVKFFIGVERDISSEKKLADQLRKERDKIELEVEERTLELSQKNKALLLAKDEISKGWLQIQMEKARFSASINSLKVGFVIFDKNGLVLFSNRALDRILGFEKKPEALSYINSSVGEQLSLKQNFEKCMADGQPIDVKEVQIKDSFLHLYFAPIFSMDNSFDIIGVVLLIDDITERKILDRSRDEFFSIASHELRTPLTAIRGNTSLIKQYYSDKLPDEDMKEMIEDIHKSSMRLIEIVNEFLNMSRLEMNKMVFNKESLNLTEIVKSVVDEYVTIASEKKLYVKFENPDNTVWQVVTDKARAREIIVNLVGNAIKYTENGGVTVKLTSDGGFVKVIIVDTGRGISKENQKLLFRKFQQASSSIYTRDALIGTGLGLYISRLMAEGLGGKIVLEKSEPNVGSEFSFSVPIG